MLHEFIAENRAGIVMRARAKVAQRLAPRPTPEELDTGVPLFLDQLIAVLRRKNNNSDAISASAAAHGIDRLRVGFTVAQVVHDYGDVCQAVTELAEELHASITTAEFHTLNKCLDDAIAEAVTEFTRLREANKTEQETERLGSLAHEMRNKLSAAMLAFATLKTGRVGIGGSTGGVLDRNLRSMARLIDRSLVVVRLDAGLNAGERFSVAQLVEEIEVEASLEAAAHDVQLTVAHVPSGIDVIADRSIVAGAMVNLLQNAFKFSPALSHISLTTTVANDRVRFDVTDACGGLPPGAVDGLFRPFERRSKNRAGIGLGLSIARRGIEASGGTVTVRDVPGKGCIFSIELARAAETRSPSGAE